MQNDTFFATASGHCTLIFSTFSSEIGNFIGYRTFTVKPDPAIHTILGDKLHNIVGYCATVKGDCYANAALYIIGENQKKERFEIAEKSTGKFLCYVW
uniref:Sema domain-containing protein n=1 Tax=Bursaphelenchus xylophilus TaxID=6326 RepID=A0A1I7RQT1_BURXY